jgi:YD repeat-containing protein
VLAEANELHAAFAERAQRSDVERMTLAVDVAEDRRALDELDQSQLLPPAVDVAKALRVLEEAGIAANAGWRYLADNVPLADQARVYATIPTLVAGVAVHDRARLSDAQAALASANLRPTTAIAVGTTADLHQAVTSAAPVDSLWLISPADALTDRSAAETEHELRALAVTEANAKDTELITTRDTATALAGKLADLATRWTLADRDRLAGDVARAINTRDAARPRIRPPRPVGVVGHAQWRQRLHVQRSRTTPHGSGAVRRRDVRLRRRRPADQARRRGRNRGLHLHQGPLTTVTDPVTRTVQTIGYNPAGQVSSIDYGAGRVRGIGYDAFGRMASDTLKNSTDKVVALHRPHL